MGNPSKQKGDRAEREAVEVLKLLAPDLVCERPERMLGAGRRDDVGDLRVFDDVAIQVRAYKELAAAIRSSAEDSISQAANAKVPFALGMVPIPRTPVGEPKAVRWLACVTEWLPTPPGEVETVIYTFGSAVTAVAWLRMKPTVSRPDVLPIVARIARIEHGDHNPIIVCPIQAWLARYRQRRLGENELDRHDAA